MVVSYLTCAFLFNASFHNDMFMLFLIFFISGLTDDTRILSTYCGSILSGPVHSSSNAMLVVFHTDIVYNLTGFAATYQTCE